MAGASVTVVTSQQPFRSGVDVVELAVAVTSGKAFVGDLTAADFEVVDNGVKQHVLSVERESVPIDVILVLDTSDSLTAALERAILSGANLIRQRLRPDDRVSLVTFNHRIAERLELRRPSEVDAIALGQKTGQTSLNDAIGVALATRAAVDRRQMAIVFTDGFDTVSLMTEADVMLAAGRSRMPLFLVSQLPALRREDLGSLGAAALPPLPQYPTAFFERLAAATGGLAQVVAPPTSNDEIGWQTGPIPYSPQNQWAARPTASLLDEPFLKALDDFRASYVVRYALTGVPRPGWHTVRVKAIRNGKTYTTRTRSGYAG
jgi:VWFA-related protein